MPVSVRQAFPATKITYLVGPGFHPQWSRDGTEQFLLTPVMDSAPLATSGIVARRVSTVPGQFGSPTPLLNIRHRIIGFNVERNYDVLPDGRFLGVLEDAAAEGKQPSAPADLQVRVIVNWYEELKRLVPGN